MLKRLTVIATLLAVTAASACGGDSGSGGKKGGTFTVVTDVPINATAPINPFAPETNTFTGYNAEWLAWPKNHLTDPNQFYPGLAESWKLGKGGNEVTVKIRKNAKWSDGKAVTAKDVKLSIDIAYTRGSGAFILTPGAAGSAREVEIVDNKTIKFTQDPAHPSNTFVRGIFDQTPIVPAHVYGKLLPDNFGELLKTAKTEGPKAEKAAEDVGKLGEKIQQFNPGKDVSAGPYVLKRVNPSAALLVRNKHFYNADKVAPDKVVIKNFSGNEQIWGYLKAGQLDAAPFVSVPAEVMKRIRAVNGNVVSKSYSPVAAGLAFNQTKKPYDDIRVRRALAYLIDRKETTKVASSESGTAATTTSGIHQQAMKPWLGAEAGKLEKYAHSEAKAESELKAAGFTKKGGKWLLPGGKPWKVTIQVVTGFSDWIAGGRNMVSQLEEFGIEAETKTSPDFDVYQEEIAKGKYAVGFWLIGLGPSAYNIFQRVYGQTNGWTVLNGKLSYAPPGKNGNWMGGPERVKVDGQMVNPGELANELQTAKGDKEKQLMVQLAKATNQDLPVIQMWDYTNTRFFSDKRFTGFPKESADTLRLSPGVWIGEGWIKTK